MENNEEEFLVCPFCGQDDIKYGASVCRGCQAEIHYGRKWGNIFATGILLILIGVSFDSWIWKLVLIALGLLCIAGGISLAKNKEPYFKRINKTDRS
ncbi:hypothetical protein [Campylobacter hominis]|uniref:hypothetical protein n=1 Tax=Campylobacter hominis TaxID=76517 RepID=UPI00248B708F|nr:hypothetical protein [Campylobacter hominis]